LNQYGFWLFANLWLVAGNMLFLPKIKLDLHLKNVQEPFCNRLPYPIVDMLPAV